MKSEHSNGLLAQINDRSMTKLKHSFKRERLSKPLCKSAEIQERIKVGKSLTFVDNKLNPRVYNWLL